MLDHGEQQWYMPNLHWQALVELNGHHRPQERLVQSNHVQSLSLLCCNLFLMLMLPITSLSLPCYIIRCGNIAHTKPFFCLVFWKLLFKQPPCAGRRLGSLPATVGDGKKFIVSSESRGTPLRPIGVKTRQSDPI